MTAITEEPTRTEQKTIMKVAVIVDLADGRGFLRTGGYRRDANNIPITQAQVRQHALRSGDHITGTRQAKSGQGSQGNQARSKARQDTTLLTVDSVNGRPAAEAKNRPSFDDLTPVYPNQRFRGSGSAPAAPPVPPRGHRRAVKRTENRELAARTLILRLA